MVSRGRLLRTVEGLGRRSGRLPPDESLIAATIARLGTFTSETGQRLYPDRPPSVYVGLTAERVFAATDRGFAATALLALLTHGQMTRNSISIQWLTPQHSGECLTVQDVDNCPAFFADLKARRDEIWYGFPRQMQVDMMILPGSLGLNWRDDPGVAEQTTAQYDKFVAGEIGVADRHDGIGLVASPIGLATAFHELHREASSAPAEPSSWLNAERPTGAVDDAPARQPTSRSTAAVGRSQQRRPSPKKRR